MPELLWLGQVFVEGADARNSDLRRYDVRQDAIEATYFVDIPTTAGLAALVGDLQQAFPAAGITFLDQSQLPSV